MICDANVYVFWVNALPGKDASKRFKARRFVSC